MVIQFLDLNTKILYDFGENVVLYQRQVNSFQKERVYSAIQVDEEIGAVQNNDARIIQINENDDAEGGVLQNNNDLGKRGIIQITENDHTNGDVVSIKD